MFVEVPIMEDGRKHVVLAPVQGTQLTLVQIAENGRYDVYIRVNGGPGLMVDCGDLEPEDMYKQIRYSLTNNDKSYIPVGSCKG